jgi:hypothetical protein
MARYFVVFAVLVSITGCAGWESSPAITPKPGDYPCHRQDGSADPNAVWCFPVDGTHTCCLENFSCTTLEGKPVCSYDGPARPPGDFDMARRPLDRTKDSTGSD